MGGGCMCVCDGVGDQHIYYSILYVLLQTGFFPSRVVCCCLFLVGP